MRVQSWDLEGLPDAKLPDRPAYALLAAVTAKPETDLGSALDRLIAAGLLFRQGVPPHATYLFKHALVQDAAYGTLLVSLDGFCMPASSKPLKASSPRLPKASHPKPLVFQCRLLAMTP